MKRLSALVLVGLLSSSCAGDRASNRTTDAETPAHDIASAAPSASAPGDASAVASADSGASPQATAPKVAFIDWVKAKLPKGGVATEDSNGKVTVTHTVRAKESLQSIAKEYLDLTDIYLWDDLMMELSKQGAVFVGKKIKIPHVVTEAYKTPDEERWAWPADKALRAIYLGGIYAVHPLQATLERMQARNMNAIVLDGKDYTGPITYPTKVQIAIDNGAAAHPPIFDLSRTIRFAHKYGVYVIMRISCFHDPWSSVKSPKLSIQSKFGKPYPIDWLDPANHDAQQYILDLEEEEIALGADEIQLDYVRFPVQRGLGNAVLPPADGSREKVLAAFVH
ncbi:MAG: putative glycoside hydrolase, partial [Polyangiaceae bacterium]